MAVVDTDVFFVRSGERTAVFAPLKGVMAELPASLAAAEREGRADGGGLAHILADLGLLVEADQRTRPPQRSIGGVFAPTGVVFMVTAACNLRCEYCYADAGDHVVDLFDRTMACDAAAWVVDNAAVAGQPQAYLNFHGGGEPTLDFDLIQYVVSWARDYAASEHGGRVRVVTSMVTNGMAPVARLEWIADNMDSVQVSYDGPPEIHDRQRPTTHGKASATIVRDAILRLQGRVPDLLVKATISAASVGSMVDIAEHFCTTFSLDRFHFGPVLGAGRGRFPQFGEPDPQAFVANYLKAKEVAERYGRTIVVSGAESTFPRIRETFCGVTDPNFALTPSGHVSSCYEVMYESDPRSESYFFGQYDPATRSFRIDTDKVVAARARSVQGLERCTGCFAKWQCAGDCQIRWRDSLTGEEATVPDTRCAINRDLIARRVFLELDRARPVHEH